MPDMDANGTHVRRLFVAASDKEMELPVEETGNSLRQWRKERGTYRRIWLA